MNFDIFCETEKAGPIGADHEATVLRETIEQARVADEVGFGCWWVVEHHGCPEFSYSSAPEILLGVIENPITKKKEEVDLERAKNFIDLLEMLAEKTEGNRTAEETSFVERILADLRMRWVDAKKSAG